MKFSFDLLTVKVIYSFSKKRSKNVVYLDF